MLTALLLYILARMRKNRMIRKNFLLTPILFIPGLLIAQGLKFEYDILRNGKKTGHIIIHQTKNGHRQTIDLEAFIKSNLVIGIRVKSKESIIMDDGMIIHSSFTRTINNRKPLNRVINFAGDHYTVQIEDQQKKLEATRISQNMASIYLNEPNTNQKIYSDASERFIESRKIAEGVYEIKLPDGGRNIYHFENRICQRIEVKQNLFNAEIRLRSISQL